MSKATGITIGVILWALTILGALMAFAAHVEIRSLQVDKQLACVEAGGTWHVKAQRCVGVAK